MIGEEQDSRSAFRVLENRYRRMGLGVTLLCCILLCIFWGQASSRAYDVPGAIEATRFVLVDDVGRTRAQLRMLSGDPTLMLIDSLGRPRFMVFATDEGAYAWFQDENGEPRLALTSKGKRVTINLRSPDKQSGVMIMTTEEMSSVGLLGAAGTPEVSLGMDLKGFHGLLFSDPVGDPRLGLVHTPSGSGLTLDDPNKRNQIFLGFTKAGPSLSLSSYGIRLFSAP